MLMVVREKLENVKQLLDSSNNGKDIEKKYKELQAKIDLQVENTSFFHKGLDKRKIAAINGIGIIGRILTVLCNEYDDCKSVEDLMQRVIRPFLKSNRQG